MREARIRAMENAVTFLRKIWLGSRTRRRYNELKQQFKGNEHIVIKIQRYTRGCLCRLKLWREAVRMEEEIWAAVEIQRAWRGYQGKVAWEDEYEVMWRCEISAALMQRQVRAWLARLKVTRMKRKIARAEFEKARKRFRAAQAIQAIARGMLTRKVTRVHRARKINAAIAIQRIERGRALRTKMWQQVIHQRATTINSLARGFLVRRRRLHLIAESSSYSVVT